MGRFQLHTRCHSSLECFLPTSRTQAPLVAGIKSRELIHWNGSRQVVSARLRELEKVCCHLRADDVYATVPRAGIAAPITVNPVNGSMEHGSRSVPNTFFADIFRSSLSLSLLGSPWHATPTPGCRASHIPNRSTLCGHRYSRYASLCE